MKKLFLFATLIFPMVGMVGGCAHEDTNLLRPTGDAIVQGESPVLMKAPDNGQVRVYDVNDDRTIWTGAIKKDQMLVLDPVNKQITLDGQACNRDDLKGGHTLKITFDRTN